MVAESDKQCVQFDFSVTIERFGYKKDMLSFLLAEIENIHGVQKVEQYRSVELKEDVRWDMSIDIERPSEDTGRIISEYLLDQVFKIDHVQEVRELTWRRLKSPLL